MNNYQKMIELQRISDDFIQIIGLKEFGNWCKKNNLKAVQSNMNKFLEADSIDVKKIASQYFYTRPGDS